MAVDISRYEKFLEVRNNAIRIIENFSVHHELKDDEYVQYRPTEEGGASELEGSETAKKIRHVGIITDTEQLLELSRLVQEWENRARELTAADPVRFPKNAFVLAPIPQIIYGVRSMSISVGGATTSKKFTKQSIIGRYERAIKRAKQSELVSHNSTLRQQLERERALLDEDKETHYRVRNNCSTETVCVVTFNDGTTSKVRVPRVGTAFAAPFGGIEIRKPRAMSPRSDRLDIMGVEPLDCSLSGLAGLLYRESEVIKAKAEYKRRNNKK